MIPRKMLNLLSTTGHQHTTPVRFAIVAAVMIFTLFISNLSRASGFEVIPLKHRPAQMLVPSLHAVASAETQITAANNQLILKGDPSEIAQLRALIDELDTPLAQFRISLRQNNGERLSSQSVNHDFRYEQHNSSGGIKIGTTTLDGKPVHSDSAQGTLSRSSSNSKYTSTTYVRNRSTQSKGNTQQTINALEGHPARIETGKEIPFFSLDRYHSTETQDYKPVVTGFYVTPITSGDERVTLEISAQKQNTNKRNNREIDTASFSSTVNARLGEWINIGGALESATNNQREIGKRYQVNSSDQYSLELKVERQY
ncbi:MAG: secretin N-terminal domain-containing protein [Cellvibrionaceae bacterium]